MNRFLALKIAYFRIRFLWDGNTRFSRCINIQIKHENKARA